MSALRFCRDCNNLLTARERRESRDLVFKCKACNNEEYASDVGNSGLAQYVIYRQNFKASVETKLETVDTAICDDPTLPRSRNVVCPACGGREAVFFRTEATAKDTSLRLVFVCCNRRCGKKWIK